MKGILELIREIEEYITHMRHNSVMFSIKLISAGQLILFTLTKTNSLTEYTSYILILYLNRSSNYAFWKILSNKELDNHFKELLTVFLSSKGFQEEQ